MRTLFHGPNYVRFREIPLHDQVRFGNEGPILEKS